MNHRMRTAPPVDVAVADPASSVDLVRTRSTTARPSVRLLPIETAAAQLGIPRSTLYRLVAQREIAATRLLTGKRSRVYIRECELEVFLVRHTQPSVQADRGAATPEPWTMPPEHERRFS